MKKWLKKFRKRESSGTGSSKSRTGHLERKAVKIPVGNVKLGMRVIRLDRPWEDTPFLFQGFVVNTLQEIEQLQDFCEFVYVDALKDVWSSDDFLDALDRETAARKPTRTLIQELPRGVRTYTDLKQSFYRILDQVKETDSLEVESLKPVVDRCVESLLSNPNALFWLTRIKHNDQYTAEHSLRVCILAVSLGVELGYSRQRLELVALAALLHDVGKTRVPDKILNKPGPLTQEEMSIMRRHSEWGAELIESRPGLPGLIAQVARHHHETLSGNGYPDKLKGTQIPSLARLVSIVDAYDAMTSKRCYKEAMPSMDSLSILYNGRDKVFDARMVEAFIRIVGIYPPGGLVELASGEVAIVVNSNNSRLRPTIMLQLDAGKKRTEQRIIDMSLPEHQAVTIIRSLPGDAYGLNMPDIIRTVSDLPFIE